MSKGKKLLIVDDEPDLREILADEFRFTGNTVFEALNGKEAWEIYLREKPDAVLSDIRMPGGDGVDLAREIKKNNPAQSRVFLITGFADLTPWDAYHIGVEGFFSKPFQLEEVRDSVLRFLKPWPEIWSEKPNQLKVRELSLPWREFLSSKKISLGRSGVFIPSNFVPNLQASEIPFRTGDSLSLLESGHEIGRGVIRWVRTDSKDRAPGLGIELVQLENSLVQELSTQHAEALLAAPFIPNL